MLDNCLNPSPALPLFKVMDPISRGILLLLLSASLSATGCLGWMPAAGMIAGTIKGTPSEEQSVNLVEELAGAASAMNQSLPMMVDSDIEMATVAAVGTSLIYTLRLVNVQPEQTSKSHVQHIVDQEIKPGGMRSACTTPNSSIMLQLGAVMVYNYYYADGTYAASYEITDEDCRNW